MSNDNTNVLNSPPLITPQQPTSYRVRLSNPRDPQAMNQKQVRSQWSDFGITGLKLGICKSLLVPATQPLQVIMRHQQGALANGSLLNASAAFKEIAKNSARTWGVPTTLFRGSISAMTKELIKNGTYKAALFKGAPKLVKNNSLFKNNITLPMYTQHFLISSMAAAIAAGADTLFGGPFERYATHRATSQGQHAQASFLKELKTKGSVKNQLKFFYKGAGATFFKTNIACLGLFAGAGPIQQQVHKAYGLQPKETIPFSAAGITAFATGGVVALMSSPLDIVKTILQRPQSADNQSTAQILKHNLNKFGSRGATAGLLIKMLMTILGWGAVSAITQQSKTVPQGHQYLHQFANPQDGIEANHLNQHPHAQLASRLSNNP